MKEAPGGALKLALTTYVLDISSCRNERSPGSEFSDPGLFIFCVIFLEILCLIMCL